MHEELEALKRILQRERAARRAAEKILEEKSLELFTANESLQQLNSSLENRYRTMVEQANDIFYRGDKDGRCIYVNQVAERILGFSQDELIGTIIPDLVTPDMREEVLLFYQDQFKNRTVNTYLEFSVATKKGDIIWLGQNLNLEIQDDKITGITGVARDITETKQATFLLRWNEDRYRRIIENMELGLLEVDVNGIVVDCNQRFEDMTGFSHAELIGKDPGLLLTDSKSKEIIDSKNAERAAGETSVYEVLCKKKTGELLWLMISGAPRIDLKGNVIGSIGIHMDITENKRILNELELAKAEAEQSALAKEKFLAHMSHEIRTPLNAVLGMTHLLEDTKVTEEQEDYLNSIRYSSEILLNIINDILDVSKIEAGEMQFKPNPFNLKKLCEDQTKTFAFKLSDRPIEVELNYDADLQENFVGDKTFLSQILMNLMGNSAKFTDKGSISLTVRKGKVFADSTVVYIEVKDTGIGIPEEQLPSIFESFKQVKNTDNERSVAGTGLGLSIAKHMTELHGGSIRVESQIGKGTTFYLAIPMETTNESIVEKVEVKSIHEKKKIDLNGMRILVAEDNEMNIKFIRRVLEKFGCAFQICRNGKEALDLMQGENFDLILMDIQMPVMDGYEATRLIRKLPSDKGSIPILALTASALADEVEKVNAAGMNGLLTKPFSPKQLEQAIDKLFEVSVEPEKALSIDQEYIESFYDGDLEYQLEMIDLFLRDIPQEVETLTQVINQNDFETAYKILHKLKPSFHMLGFVELTDEIEQIEELADQKNPECWVVLKPMLKVFGKVFKIVVEEKQKLKNQL